MAILGLVLTLAGFAFTIYQVQGAVRATEAVRKELARVHNSLNAYDGASEAARALSALKNAKKNLRPPNWREVHESYEQFSNALHIVNVLQIPELSEQQDNIMEALRYAKRLCERIDASEDANVTIDAAKTASAIRDHEQLVTTMAVMLQRKAIH